MKKNYYKMCIMLVMISFVLVGCDEERRYGYSHPHVLMKSVYTIDRQNGEFAKILIEFENIGEQTAYDLTGMLSINIGNTIIESENFRINGINRGQTVFAEIWLTSIETHHEYEYYSIDFGWYDYWDHYYE